MNMHIPPKTFFTTLRSHLTLVLLILGALAPQATQAAAATMSRSRAAGLRDLASRGLKQVTAHNIKSLYRSITSTKSGAVVGGTSLLASLALFYAGNKKSAQAEQAYAKQSYTEEAYAELIDSYCNACKMMANALEKKGHAHDAADWSRLYIDSNGAMNNKPYITRVVQGDAHLNFKGIFGNIDIIRGYLGAEHQVMVRWNKACPTYQAWLRYQIQAAKYLFWAPYIGAFGAVITGGLGLKHYVGPFLGSKILKPAAHYFITRPRDRIAYTPLQRAQPLVIAGGLACALYREWNMVKAAYHSIGG